MTIDYNNDGKLDLLMDSGKLYKNTLTSNNFLIIKLIGVRSPRDPMGSKVTIIRSEDQMIVGHRELIPSYNRQQPPKVIFAFSEFSHKFLISHFILDYHH